MLRDVLNNIADFLEKEEDVRSKIIAALAYPILMLIVGIATIFILMGFVIPKLADMFIEMGEVLPLPTRILIGFSGFIQSYWIMLVIFAGAFIFFIVKSKSNAAFKKMIDKFKLRLPLAGTLMRDSELARFARTLSTLLKNGVPILYALEITSDVIENEVIKGETLKIHNDVKAGLSLAAAIKKSSSFPQFVVNMATIGEEGGILDKTLLKVARSYEIENDRKIKVLSSLIEPVIILLMGLVVGFIVISMLLPVFQISLTAH
ncbi:MAG: type II secretion system F family protein [Candidatus Omnitrophica bacterium]|nr:type II secretion system F family protein [Candidatus Omnitrophota bacterium]